jgi:hypothetical protein
MDIQGHYKFFNAAQKLARKIQQIESAPELPDKKLEPPFMGMPYLRLFNDDYAERMCSIKISSIPHDQETVLFDWVFFCPELDGRRGQD